MFLRNYLYFRIVFVDLSSQMQHSKFSGMANLYYPYIKPNYVASDGKTPLYVRYNYNHTKRTLIFTGYNIKPDHWDDKKRWIKRACPEFDDINFALTKITSKLGDILTYAKDNGIDPIVDFVLLESEKNREYEQRSNRVNCSIRWIYTLKKRLVKYLATR